MKKGFTLIELLIVIAIIAILLVVVVTIINPAALLQEGRDATRISDMSTLNKAVSLYYQDAMNNPSTLFMGTSSVIYVSIPDPAATSTAGDQCQGLGLPTLPTGYTYHCAASSTYMQVNGTGWIPINFTSYVAGSVISKLPVDPVNTTSTNLYYTYETDGVGGFKVAAFFESQKDAPQMTNDGGNDAELYEKGSNLALASGRGLIGYWPMDEGTGSSTIDHSGNSSTAVFSGSPIWTTGKVGPWSLQETNVNYLNFQTASTALPTSAITITLWEKTSASQNWMRYLNNSWVDAPGSWLLYSNASGNLLWGISGPATSTQNNSTCNGPLTLNTWQFLAATYDGTTMRTYINGVQCAMLSLANQTLWTGGYLDNNVSVAGGSVVTDDVRIYDRALSATEIQEMYNAEK